MCTHNQCFRAKKTQKKYIIFHLKMNIFTAVKYCCILHGRVCVMSLDIVLFKGVTNQLHTEVYVSYSSQEPVVQSIVSLTTSLRHQLVKYMPTKLSNTLLFVVEKM